MPVPPGSSGHWFQRRGFYTAGVRPVKEVIRQADPVVGFALIKEKTFIDLALVHVMKGIDHVVKAKPHRRFNELSVGDFTSVVLQAGFQKLAATGGDLFWRMLQVLAKITAERYGKLVERNQIAARLIHFIQR